MITGSSLDKLRSYRISGFIEELERQSQSSTYQDLSFEERLTLLIDAEHARRTNAMAQRLMKRARIPSSVALEDVDFSVPRGIAKTQLLELVQGEWLRNGTTLIITGPTGIGKSFLASVISHELCDEE